MKQTQPSLTGEGKPKAGNPDDLHSTFVQNVEHELRTPLAIIQGYAELLRDGSLGALAPEQQKAIFTLTDHVSELRTLVERIGVLLAVEAQMSLSEPLALTEVVARVVEKKRAKADEAGLTLEEHLEPALPLVSGEPYHLQQAIDCLLENALKFTPSGGRVEVQVYPEPGWVCLAVTDTGIGIAEEGLERIFTPFYQVDSSTTRRYSGIGLGLTVARAVIEKHGGQIEVESQPGQGSRFTVKLPALSSEPQVDQSIEGGTALRRILIVDDEEIVTLTLRDILEELPDCEIAVATSGEQALQLFEQQPLDLLITDYKMPNMDGLTLATRVRQLYPRTATIMITAHGSAALREQAALASIQRTLDKPVKLAEIRRAALEVLEGPESSQAGGD